MPWLQAESTPLTSAASCHGREVAVCARPPLQATKTLRPVGSGFFSYYFFDLLLITHLHK